MSAKTIRIVTIKKRKFAYQLGVTYTAVQEVMAFGSYYSPLDADSAEWWGLEKPLPSFVCELQYGIDPQLGVKQEINKRLKGEQSK